MCHALSRKRVLSSLRNAAFMQPPFRAPGCSRRFLPANPRQKSLSQKVLTPVSHLLSWKRVAVCRGEYLCGVPETPEARAVGTMKSFIIFGGRAGGLGAGALWGPTPPREVHAPGAAPFWRQGSGLIATVPPRHTPNSDPPRAVTTVEDLRCPLPPPSAYQTESKPMVKP